MTKRGAFTLETARTILDQSKRFDQIAARAGMGGDLRKRKPQQFRLALVTATSDEDSTSSDCGEVNVVRIQLIDATFAEQLGTRQLEKSLVPKKLYFAAVPIGSDVTVGDVIEVAWWNKRYWFLGSVTSPCGASSGSASDFSTSVSGSGGGDSGDPSASASGGAGSGSGGSGGAGSGSGSGPPCVDCGTCGCVPQQLTLTLTALYESDGGTPFHTDIDCISDTVLTWEGTGSNWYKSGVTPPYASTDPAFGNVGGTDCTGLDGCYRYYVQYNCVTNQLFVQMRCWSDPLNNAFIKQGSAFLSTPTCAPFSAGDSNFLLLHSSNGFGVHFDAQITE